MNQESLINERKAFEDEMKYWRNKCQLIEKKVDDEIKANSDTKYSETMKSFKDDIGNIQEGMSYMEKNWNNWLVNLTEKFLESDQYFRRGNLLIGGYKSLPKLYGSNFIVFAANEVNRLFPSLPGTVLPIHIDDAHPLRTKKNNNGKIMIIKFTNRWIKNDILRCKRDIEGSGFTVTEHLTPHTLELRSSAEKLVGRENVKVTNTMVSARFNGFKYPIRTIRDIEALQSVVMVTEKDQKTCSTEGNDEPPPPGCSSVIMTSPAFENTAINNDSNSNAIESNEHSNHSQFSQSYSNNYPAFYQKLIVPNVNNSPTRLPPPPARGKTSRYGRGRGGYHRGRSYNNSNYVR